VTIVRVGATKKYSDGWESAFGKGKTKTATAAKTASPKKSAAKKKSSAKNRK
jgi:hypothetical protein